MRRRTLARFVECLFQQRVEVADRRFRLLEDLQEQIVGGINAGYLGETVDVLFEEKVKGRWRGRTPTNKLVFVESEDDLRGKLLPVTVTWTGPWSMLGEVV